MAFTLRFTYEPAQGKAGEPRAAVERFAKRLNSAGGRTSVSILVAGDLGANAVARIAAFADLAAFEASLARVLADPATQEFQRSLAPVLAGSAQAPELFRILNTPA